MTEIDKIVITEITPGRIIAAAGNGDMKKEVYDTNDDGIVDNAALVNGHTVETDIPANTIDRIATLEAQVGDIDSALDAIIGTTP